MNRRNFIKGSLACGFTCSAHLQGLAAADPGMAQRLFAAADDKIVAKEKWARIERIHDGVFAIVSTPFESKDYTTVCNGGLIVGDKGVLVVEAFMQAKGASWVRDQSLKLTGKSPSDIVVTHYHGDHSSGHQGFEIQKASPHMWLTDYTRKQAEKSFAQQNQKNEFSNTKGLSVDSATEIDLGNRKVKVTPRSGHTQSDVTIEISDPKVIFCGDLFFNRMFPNYLDAAPTKLNQFAAEMKKEKDAVFVPGHGPVASQKDLSQYIEFLGFVEDHAQQAFKKGTPAEKAAESFQLPKQLEDWLIWSPQVVKRACDAWYREWNAKG